VSRFVEIAVDVPIRGTFHYEWGAPLGEVPAPGARVAVPFGRSRRTGYVLREVDEDEARAAAGGRELREVASVKDRETLVTPSVLELARWVARHYLAGPGEVLSAVLPAGVRKGARAARVKIVKAALPSAKLLEEAGAREKRAPKIARALEALAESGELTSAELAGGRSDAALVRRLVKDGFASVREELADPLLRAAEGAVSGAEREPFELTSAQSLALERCRKMRARTLDGEPPFGMLLEGVTGSGKTEVYLRAIAEEVARGRSAIVLVPELTLTPQTIERFGERFGRLGLLHSHLTEGARADEWRRIRAGEVDVVIGARSALFAPLPQLGIIVVDEEHETSYKQESSPRYHARDAALKRAEIERASVILGSATPSLESFHAARRGGLDHAVLPERIGGRPLPPVAVVDMRAERREVKGYPVLSGQLVRALGECVDRGEQAILFLNRRGYSTFLRCARCGEDVRCEKCDVPLVYHKTARAKKKKAKGATPARAPSSNVLRCHYCGEARPLVEVCSHCGFGKLLRFGTGTERVVDEIAREVPAARVARVDADAMARREDYERVLGKFRSGSLDVLVGTQIIAKGLDLPRVTLVGVVNADTALRLADFRASERTFQLIAQVAGRAGRSDLGGRVIVQTELPESLPVRAGAKHDMEAFADEELAHRRDFAYPPFTRLARIVVEGPREETVEKKVKAVARALEPAEGEPAPHHSVLGPAEAPLGKLRGRRRQHVIVKADSPETLEAVLWGAEKALRGSGATRVIVDVDPASMR